MEEAASIAVIQQSAFDTNKPIREKLSNANLAKAIDVVNTETITFACISFSRNDIATANHVENSTTHNFSLRMTEKFGLKYSEVNPNADEEFSYNDVKWKQARLAAIDGCLTMGANIVSLGEFDYPPMFVDTDITSFNSDIQTKIDAVDRPVFLIAGTRHDPNPATGECFNRARIFINKALNTAPRSEPLSGPITHDKLVSAEKSGEKISVPPGVEITYYDTCLGNIAVLICVDAYNPSVIFSMINQRRNHRKDFIDYIIVPSYNSSPKLYYACQVLSLLCQCSVLLVDACGVSSQPSNKKPAEIEFFVHGRSFSHIKTSVDEENTNVGEELELVEMPHVRGWKLNLDYMIEYNNKKPKITPFFDSVDNLAGQEIFPD
ncbi:MAG: hypothetical protein GY743_03630 [Planctomycetaceae bacterium]|nr:hypothetical protein [Planctomycetaceae bacterium]